MVVLLPLEQQYGMSMNAHFSLLYLVLLAVRHRTLSCNHLEGRNILLEINR